MLYGWIHLYYYGGADTWAYVEQSRLIYDSFYINPLYFLELTFAPNAREIPVYLKEIVAPLMAWSDVRTYMVLRVNALIHFFSMGYYNVHVVFWNVFSFIGLMGIYQTFLRYFPNYRKALLLIVFFTPSVLFWSSGVHKDGLSFFCVGLLLYHFSKILDQQKEAFRFLIIGLSMGFLFLLRPYILGILLPFLLIWGWTFYASSYTFLKYLGVAISTLLLVPFLNYVSFFDVLGKIAATQHFFIKDSIGKSDFSMTPLENNFVSLLQSLPFSWFNTIIRPAFFNWSNHLPKILAALENGAILVFLLSTLFFINTNKIKHKQKTFWYFCFFFGFAYLGFVGLIVDNIGAIVRYRCIVLPFLLTFWLVMLDKERLIQFLQKWKRNKIGK